MAAMVFTVVSTLALALVAIRLSRCVFVGNGFGYNKSKTLDMFALFIACQTNHLSCINVLLIV